MPTATPSKPSVQFGTTSHEIITIGRLKIDAAARVLKIDGAPVKIYPSAVLLLAALARGKGRVMRREELVKEMGSSASPHSNLVDVYIAKLRRTLRVHGLKDLITTVVAVGYALEVAE